MISDRDVYAAANLFMKRFGESALTAAMTRADMLGAENDMDGKRLWLRIIEAIKQLQRTRAPDEAVNCTFMY